MTVALECHEAEPRKPYRILMILNQPFPPDIRVENEASAVVEEGLEIILLILAPDGRESIENTRGIQLYTGMYLKNSAAGCGDLWVQFQFCLDISHGKSRRVFSVKVSNSACFRGVVNAEPRRFVFSPGSQAFQHQHFLG